MLLQPALAPGVELLFEVAVEATDGAGGFQPLPARFRPLLLRMSCTRASHEHFRECLRHLSWPRYCGVEELGIYSSKEGESHYAEGTANLYERVQTGSSTPRANERQEHHTECS